MPFDGNGNFVPLSPPDYPAVAGEIIYSDRFNAVINDLIAGLSEALPRNGEGAATGDLALGGFKLTGLGAGSVPGDSIEYQQWLNGFFNTQLTGTPTAPTAAAGTNTTQVATTAHVFAERSNAATLTNKTLTAPIITTPSGLVKADVGLSDVDNTSDLDKPISTATQTALNAKQDADSDLTAVAGLSTSGLIVRTGSGTAATRTITAGAGVTVTDGDGVSGDPTIAVTPGVGTGDVLGPSGAVDGDAVVFDGLTGKVIKSLGAAPVAKSGGTMTGPLEVPAGASGAQVPQAQEVRGLAILTPSDVTGTTGTVANGEHKKLINAAATTVTAPAAASVGHRFRVSAMNGRVDNVINWNGLKHENLSDATTTLDVAGCSVEWEYTGASYGWKRLSI